ncbi:pyridoxine/pyridoxamine 5'-phosphate oxidase-like [Vespula squamosa]|uniref:Pyridoxine/pyridoxamine 5'-phosphate oxidase-like n=1 Tax=Vespula squamosa TaxID=30214 RepID=A0ABD2BGA8_VESSQ
MSNEPTNLCNVDIRDMRVKYKNGNETFTEEDLVSKEPIGQFKAWFEEACKTPQIFEPNAILLTPRQSNLRYIKL